MNSPNTAAPARRIARKLFEPIEKFLRVEAASGIVLMIAAAVALTWANSPFRSTYDALWHTSVTLAIGSFVSVESLHFWINEGLMTIFFLVVGLEIRSEIHQGALQTPKLAALPVVAALGGMVAPALIYITFNQEPLLRQGWAIPTATDIAFAVGVLALLGRRVAVELRVLLLALAIIDDIGAVLVIAFFYSSGVAVGGLIVAAFGVLLVLVFQQLGMRSALMYIIPGAVVWLGLFRAGIHPTLAGVVLGLLTPAKPLLERQSLLQAARRALDSFKEPSDDSGHHAAWILPRRQLKQAHDEIVPPVLRVQAALHPWVAYGIMPLFAFANAGVNFGAISFEYAGAASVTLGIFLGLVVGKPLGILLASLLSAKIGLVELPAGVTARGLWVVGCLGGIGFTMSIFISNLAFTDAHLLDTAKFAVLAASLAASILGLLMGRMLLKERTQ